MACWVEFSDDVEFPRVGCEFGGFSEDRGVSAPFEPGVVEEGGAADRDFADVGGEGGFGADCAEEGVPLTWFI